MAVLELVEDNVSALRQRRLSDGRVVAELRHVGAALGYGNDSAIVHELAGKARLKVKTITTPQGEVVDYEAAVKLLADIRSWMDGYYDAQAAYRAYVQRTREEAARKRAAEAAEELKRQRADAISRHKAWTEQEALKAREEIAEKQRRQAAKEGNPMSAAEFFKQLERGRVA